MKGGQHNTMNEIKKRGYIIRIINELENLNATSFEQLCHHLLEITLKSKLIYRGTTVSGAPTGYTTDTYNSDLSIIAEYSTDKTYFSSKKFSKPLSDVDHALSESTKLKSLYLYSSRTANNKELTNLIKEVTTKLINEKRTNITLEIYDARRIAMELVELLKFIDYSSDLVIHFPALEQIIDEHSMTNSLPEVKAGYLKRDEESIALSILDSHNLLFLYGISGIGKTDLAVSIADQLKVKHMFDVIVWVEGREINSVESLSCLEIERVQSKQNILGLIKRKRVLLVIDGLDSNVDEIIPILLKENNNDSKIIITSQKNSSLQSLEGKIHIDFLDDTLAKCILNHNVPKECPIPIFLKIKEAIGCHPLLLEIINKGVQYDGITWKDIEEETLNLPNHEDTHGQIFFKRLLQSHFQAIQNEMKVIKWLDGQTFNKMLLQKLISKLGINKLLKLSFLKDYKGLNYKMHDLVFSCIRMQYIELDRTKEYYTKLSSYFSENINIKDFQYYNALHVHKNLIRKLVLESNMNFELVPTFLTLDGLKLSDYENILYRINIDELQEKRSVEQIDRFKISSYIECVENIHRIIKAGNPTEAQAYASDKTPVLKKLLEISHNNNELKYEVMHHLGKFYTFIKAYDLAKECFYSVIRNTNDSYHSKLQLAKFSSGVDIEEAKSYLRDIFLAFEEDPSKVSISVVLAAFNELKKTAYYELTNQFLLDGNLFETAIMYSSVWGYSQPFQVMTEVGKTISYQQPERYIKIVKHLPEESRELKSESELFYLGQIYKELGKCYPTDSKESISSFSLANTYFERIPTDNSYYCTMIGELYILMKFYDNAIEVLNKVVTTKRNHFWYQRLSQAYQGKEEYNDALVFIEKAIEGITKPLDEKYRSAFLRQKGKILASMNEKIEAHKFYKAAIECSNSNEFKNEIENEMKVLSL